MASSVNSIKSKNSNRSSRSRKQVDQSVEEDGADDDADAAAAGVSINSLPAEWVGGDDTTSSSIAGHLLTGRRTTADAGDLEAMLRDLEEDEEEEMGENDDDQAEGQYVDTVNQSVISHTEGNADLDQYVVSGAWDVIFDLFLEEVRRRLLKWPGTKDSGNG